MKPVSLIFAVFLSTLMLGGNAMAFTLKSSAFAAGGTVPAPYTCDGEDLSPPLSWENPPSGTKSFALILDDPDAPPGTWVHWVLYDLPMGTSHLEEGLAKEDMLPSGAKQGLAWGVQSFSRVGYYGPCPPPGKPHRYIFKLYALDKVLDLKPKVTKPDLLKAMEGHILGQTSLTGIYGR